VRPVNVESLQQIFNTLMCQYIVQLKSLYDTLYRKQY